MTFSPDRDYIQNVLRDLLSIPSPSGYCGVIMERLGEAAGQLGFKMKRTPKGGGVIVIPGTDRSRTIGLSAHVDTLGAMVRSVKPDGRLKFTLVGGYMLGSVENEYCRVHTRSGREFEGTIMSSKPSVHVFADARDLKREESVMEIRLDERVSSAADVKALGIGTGDFISFEPRMQFLENGYIKSRHLDDKAGVAAVFGLLEMISRQGLQPACDVQVVISTYEEVGHGAAWIPAEISELIAVDMGAMGDDLQCTELDVSICAKDSSGPYDYEMTGRLIELARQEGIAHAVDIYPHYGSDASAALRGGSNIRAALIGPGVHASHAMERTHIEAVEGTTRLLAAYIQHPAAPYTAGNE